MLAQRSGLEALVGRGFELHAMQAKLDLLGRCRELGKQMRIVAHSALTPVAYAQLLRQMSFVVGLGDPTASPTPLEGLANGAAFLNPHQFPRLQDTQHPPLAIMLGPPYVYQYALGNASELLAAAERASQHRFASYVPESHTLNATVAAVCKSILNKPTQACGPRQ